MSYYKFYDSKKLSSLQTEEQTTRTQKSFSK